MKVSWDYDIPNIWKVIKFMFQNTNQERVQYNINPYENGLIRGFDIYHHIINIILFTYR